MKFKSKAHMVQELLSGKKFKDTSGFVIYYDEKLIGPFRWGEDELRGVWADYDRDIWTEVIELPSIHQDLIDNYQKGQVWQYRYNGNADWLDATYPSMYWEPDWKEDTQYRLHPHNTLIQAHNNGADIQAFIRGNWIEAANPNWNEDIQYRVKPNTKTVYEWMFKSKYRSSWKVDGFLLSEEEAEDFFDKHEYKKTGRSWEVEV